MSTSLAFNNKRHRINVNQPFQIVELIIYSINMDGQSPPKRVTRARAAAKTNDNEVKTAKIATAALKAKVTRSTSTTKRNTRADNIQDEEENNESEQVIQPEPEPTKTTRGRPKKAAAQPEPEMEDAPAPAKTIRGRPKKATVEAPAPEPTRTTRGRAKKVEIPEEEAVVVVEEATKKAPRTRAATVSKATAPKKSVKFEEPDKENVVPPPANAKGKAKATEEGTGLRAKPVRKPAVTTRATRGRAKTVAEEEAQKPSPLSPKKATQVAKGDNSDDELAANEKTPMKPLTKSPIKPPGSILGAAKKLDFSNSITVNRAITQDLSGSVMASPARRPPQSHFKDSFKASPQKVELGGSRLGSPFRLPHPATHSDSSTSQFRASLLQSPARRPQSPTKVTESGSPSRSSNNNSVFSQTPKANTFKISRFATPKTLNKSIARSGQMLPPSAPPKMSIAAPEGSNMPASNMSAEPSLKFSGRLSSIMPREADPALNPSEPITEESEEQSSNQEETALDPMIVDEVETIEVEDSMDTQSTTPPYSPPRNSTGAFGLREEDENPLQDSDSEDELASGSPKYSPVPLAGFNISSHDFASSPATPTPFAAIMKTPGTSMGPRSCADIRSVRREKTGFTPLARQLTDWMAASPDKSGKPEDGGSDVEQPSPAKSTFFEDEMSVRDQMVAVPAPEAPEPNIIDEFGPVELDEEDLALANEADEMSLLEPDVLEDEEDPAHTAENAAPAPSEASQEYGDENAMPVDPELLALPTPSAPAETPAFTTPKRILSERVFHTVSKVPLKPAAEDLTPMRPSPMKRSATISRLPVQRPSNTLTRNNTVISYSPTKHTPRRQSPPPPASDDVIMQGQGTYITPSKTNTDMWSTIGTPARTPRRDLNTQLLKGAVVFVDVYTTEGADASVLFTELLTQMGARCVKSWNWNSNEEGSKIGITHVVFKDGGKRTLEKARETNGVVSCVGVGWILE
jgi:hypothetical protein